MILALDVGNTKIKAALFERGQIVSRASLATAECTSPAAVEGLLRSLCGGRMHGPAGPYVAIASVVPSVEQHIEQALLAVQRSIRLPAIFVSSDKDLGIHLAVDHPERLGADRIADAVAAVEQCGCPVGVVSCGSAVTLTLVDGSRRLVGGAIAPGPLLAARSLAAFTGRLPLVDIPEESALPPITGTDTVPAIRTGILHAFAGTVRAFAEGASEVLGPTAPLIVTGGFGRLAEAVLATTATLMPDLTVIGVRRIAIRNGAAD